MSTRTQGFKQAVGKWVGTAEVYDGNGRFVGNAADQRHVQQQAGENRVRIDLSFIGPLKFAGHYFIEDHQDFRLYQGPANTGFAETLSDNLIDAHAYWPVTGLTQRFFLMILPDNGRQMSLALMSRGEKLIYAIVGEYQRVQEDSQAIPALVNGTAYDLHDDPTGGREQLLLHRSGRWQGELSTLNGRLEKMDASRYVESVSLTGQHLQVQIAGTAFAPGTAEMTLKTNQWEAWSTPGNLVGSYNLSGGRALSGHFHYLEKQLRVWRREVVSHDGRMKVVVHTWYRGGERIGIQFGLLNFESRENGRG